MCGTFLLRSVAWLLLLKRRRSWCKDQTLPRKSTSTAFGQLGTAREDHRLAVMGGCVVMWAGWSTSTAPCSRLRPSWTSRPVRAWQPITTEMRDAQQTDRRSLEGCIALACRFWTRRHGCGGDVWRRFGRYGRSRGLRRRRTGRGMHPTPTRPPTPTAIPFPSPPPLWSASFATERATLALALALALASSLSRCLAVYYDSDNDAFAVHPTPQSIEGEV